MCTIKWSPLAALFILLCSCSGVTVNHDYDVTANFSQYKTFDWVPGEQPRTGDIRVDNPLLDNRIRAAVERVMIEKGYRKATAGKPDLLVAYNLTIRSKIESDTVSTGVGYGGYPYWGGVGFETRVREYDEGMLVIDLGDARENKLIWRGTGTRRITQQASPEKTTEIVNKTVAEILAQFPPEQK
jgi:hypothetical protein